MIRPYHTAFAPFALLLAVSLVSACSSDAKRGSQVDAQYVLGSVVIDPEDNRTTYVQTVASLEGHFDNASAIELPGNGSLMARGPNFFVALTEDPTWVRYSIDDSGNIFESGRISFLNYGVDSIDYGNAFVDDETAVSVLSGPALAVIWNPLTMAIKGTVDLGFLHRDGYSLEVWTTIAHDGLIYVPARWADWEGPRVYDGVSTTIIDPKTLSVVGTAEDDRCASGGRVVFDAKGYAYVMGDGRNYARQMFANASGETAPENCLLRIRPGETSFDKDFFFTIPSLTGGLESITELQSATDADDGVAFSKMFYPAELPADVKPVDFAFWDYPAHKLWRIELGDEPTAKEVDGAPFAAIGFDGSAMGGRLFNGESTDQGATSDIFETDPKTNTAKFRFSMDGYFDGLYKLTK